MTTHSFTSRHSSLNPLQSRYTSSSRHCGGALVDKNGTGQCQTINGGSCHNYDFLSRHTTIFVATKVEVVAATANGTRQAPCPDRPRRRRHNYTRDGDRSWYRGWVWQTTSGHPHPCPDMHCCRGRFQMPRDYISTRILDLGSPSNVYR